MNKRAREKSVYLYNVLLSVISLVISSCILACSVFLSTVMVNKDLGYLKAPPTHKQTNELSTTIVIHRYVSVLVDSYFQTVGAATRKLRGPKRLPPS